MILTTIGSSSRAPTKLPTQHATLSPSKVHTNAPSTHSSMTPSARTRSPSVHSSASPSSTTTFLRTSGPSALPIHSLKPSTHPSSPSPAPAPNGYAQLGAGPTVPTASTTYKPTVSVSESNGGNPSNSIGVRNFSPSAHPSNPSNLPTEKPSNPTAYPSSYPTNPTYAPTCEPSYNPTSEPV